MTIWAQKRAKKASWTLAHMGIEMCGWFKICVDESRQWSCISRMCIKRLGTHKKIDEEKPCHIDDWKTMQNDGGATNFAKPITLCRTQNSDRTSRINCWPVWPGFEVVICRPPPVAERKEMQKNSELEGCIASTHKKTNGSFEVENQNERPFFNRTPRQGGSSHCSPHWIVELTTMSS